MTHSLRTGIELLKAGRILNDKDVLMMTKFEKRLCILALVFVIIYIGAAAITIHTRIYKKEDSVARFESNEITPGERQLLMAELFL